MDDRASPRIARDDAFPMDPMEMSCFDIRACTTPPAPRRSQDSKAAKRKGTSSPARYSANVSLSRYNATGYWIPTSSRKRNRLQQPQEDAQLDAQLHQSTCLNLNMDATSNCASTSAESDLWILPDFDDWELDTEAHQLQEDPTARRDGGWAPLVKRAVHSNRERLRRRLEGDGWDFVGGKYGEDETALKEGAHASEESVDDEFDVVVLPVLQVSC